MGKMKRHKIDQALKDAVVWLHKFMSGKHKDDYHFQLFVVVLAQLIYGAYGTLCKYLPDEHVYNVVAQELRTNVPILGNLIGDIVSCRNLICHANGSEKTDKAVDALHIQQNALIDLMFFIDSSWEIDHVKRLSILRRIYPNLNLPNMAELIPDTVWNDPIQLINTIDLILKSN